MRRSMRSGRRRAVISLAAGVLMAAGHAAPAGQSGTTDAPAPLPRELAVAFAAPGERLAVFGPVRIAFAEGKEKERQAWIALAPEDGAAFAAFTRRHLGEVVALEICGEVLARPRLQTAIEGGVIALSQQDAVGRLAEFAAEGCP